MKQLSIFLLVFIIGQKAAHAQTLQLTSPDKNITVEVEVKDKVYYSVKADNEPLLNNSFMQLYIGDEVLGSNPKLLKKTTSTINEQLKPVVPFKNTIVNNNCNVLALTFKGDYSIEFRVYNDGVAYRFITRKKDSVAVTAEDAHFGFVNNDSSWYSPESSFFTAYETPYAKAPINNWKENKMSTLPVLIGAGDYKLLISEADLYDYPCMFVKPDGDNALSSAFPKVPLAFAPKDDRTLKITSEADYIAKTSGNRSFPWRFIVVAKEDKDIVENEMVYKLSRKTTLTDTAWIKPGHVSWEWWHGARIYGVDFKAGLNLETYKYYVDFASKFNIPYIIMDEGWSKSTIDVLHPNPNIDLQQLIAYGKQKNVKIILWFTWLSVENNYQTIFKQLADWGIAGAKIDFMNRSDQWMVNWYEKIAKEAFKHHILVDYHGAFKPAGLSVAYPNILAHEGVTGMEQNIGGGLATPDNNMLLPFIRNAVGPMDYTPGAMFNVQPEDYKPTWTNTMSIGTRCNQLAMYIVYESGLQMLADNPFNYYREEDCTKFIAGSPVTWDETKVLAAKAGEYVVIARRKGTQWYIGAMTNHEPRELNIPINFLGQNETASFTIFQDGVNADVQAKDYKKLTKAVKNGDTLTIKMVRNGGFVATTAAL